MEQTEKFSQGRRGGDYVKPHKGLRAQKNFEVPAATCRQTRPRGGGAQEQGPVKFAHSADSFQTSISTVAGHIVSMSAGRDTSEG